MCETIYSAVQNGVGEKGIIYCRVSSLEQVDGTSLESQERLCREYATREGIAVVAAFIERGESAKTADRTEFMKAVAFCSDKKNKVHYFIVYKIDRFSRNQTDYAIIKQKLKKYGTEIRSVSEKIDDTPSGKLMEVMLSGFAEFDNNIRTERSVNGMRERIKQGVWVWAAPLGYRRLAQGANLSPDPKYAPYIRLAFTEYAKGVHTFDSLAKHLNERGYSSRRGYPAIPQLVEKIIKNPIYCGIIRVWDLEVQGSFEPLVDEALFRQCQESGRRHKSSPRVAKNPDFPLRKLVVCAYCGQRITGSYSTGGRGGRYPYYHHPRQNCDHAASVPKESLERMFAAYLRSITPSARFEKLFKQIVLDIWKNKSQKSTEQLEQVRKEIRALEERRKMVYEFFESGTYTREEFIVQRDMVNRRIAEKDTLTADIRSDGFDIEEALEYCFNVILDTAKTWSDLENEPDQRLWFQKMIFKAGNVPFYGERFGTVELAPIYRLYEEYSRDSSTLVTHVITNWNSILIHLRQFCPAPAPQPADLSAA